MKEMHQKNVKLSNGGKYILYMIAKNFFIVTNEAQHFIASKECSAHRIAAVVVLKNSGLQLLATLFIKFFKSTSPSYIFKSEAEALKWMRAEYQKQK